MTTQAKPCFGYWAAHYINRDGGWSVACDALGRIIRCETEKLALSVAPYRRRRLQPLRGSSTNPSRVESRHGSDVTWSNGVHRLITRIRRSLPRGNSTQCATSSFDRGSKTAGEFSGDIVSP